MEPARHRRSYRYRLGRRLFLLLSAALAGGCLGDVELGGRRPNSCDFVEPSADEDKVYRLSVLTFWSEDPQEAAALKELEDRGREDARVTIGREANSNREELQLNMQEGNSDELPNVFQVNGGSDVLQYVGREEGNGLCALDRLVEQYDLESKYFDAALAPSRCAGSLFAWPLSIHRLNTMLVNREVYRKMEVLAEQQEVELPRLEELSSARELIEFLDLAGRLGLKDAEGNDVVPLSLGIQDIDRQGNSDPVGQEWVLLILAFENLLASYGHGAYEAIWYGSGGLSDQELGALIRRLSQDLKDLGDLTFSTPRSWQEATMDVAQGRSLLTIGGDWMRAQVGRLSLVSGEVETRPFPGSEYAFVYTPDSFAVPASLNSAGEGEHQLLRDVVHHPETQVQFARRKQAIPARSDLSRAQLEGLGFRYLVDSYHVFGDCHRADSSCRLLLAVSGLGPPPNISPCFDRLGRVIALLAGMDAVPVDGEDECERPMPTNFEEAEGELIEELREVRQNSFRAECRGLRPESRTH